MLGFSQLAFHNKRRKVQGCGVLPALQRLDGGLAAL